MRQTKDLQQAIDASVVPCQGSEKATAKGTALTLAKTQRLMTHATYLFPSLSYLFTNRY